MIDVSVTKGISSYAENFGFTHELVSLCISGGAKMTQELTSHSVQEENIENGGERSSVKRWYHCCVRKLHGAGGRNT